MKKILIFCLIIFLLAAALSAPVAFNPPEIDLTGITGLFVKTGSAIVTVARIVIKQVLSVIVKIL